jgi:hypothetical protein
MRLQLIVWLAAGALQLACVSDGDSGGTGGSGGGGGAPPAGPVAFTIDSSTSHPISPYIYGTNSGDLTKEAKGLTLSRLGGNRLTAYNWENNFSNAGADWQYSSDNYLSSSTTPGAAMLKPTQATIAAGASMILTIPIAGWVSADGNGSCPSKPTAAQIAERFFPVLPRKGAVFAYPPDLTDGRVYADEAVAYLETQFATAQATGRRLFYMLDNEPDIWAETHSEIHPDKVTYAEILQKGIDFATGIKAAAPGAQVLGPVNYGWQGMVNLQGAPDAKQHGDFLEFYLGGMKAAEAAAGQRLLDVLDVHWYPEAKGVERITNNGTSAADVEARLQAPRSLWDKSYTEQSWIAQSTGPIYLLPRLQAKIDKQYPGTKLSISEYNYGAGGDISGGIAQADVLGVFGREGLYAASVWLVSASNDFLWAGFAMYRNYDGAGATFGDTSIAATSSAVESTSIYASVFAADPSRIVAVAINKANAPVAADIALAHPTPLGTADVYTLTAASATPTLGTALAATGANTFSYEMPARSVTTLVFKP